MFWELSKCDTETQSSKQILLENGPLKKNKQKWLWDNMSIFAYDCKMYIEP